MPPRRPGGYAAGIQIVVTGVDATSVHAGMMRLQSALGGPGLVHFFDNILTPYLQERARDRFVSEGDDVSGPWAPLRAFTQKVRAAKGYGAAHPINRRTGELENFVTNSSAVIVVGSEGGRMRYPGRTPGGELGRKMRTAQTGRSNFPPTVPRPVLGLSSRDAEAIVLGLMMHVAGTP